MLASERSPSPARIALVWRLTTVSQLESVVPRLCQLLSMATIQSKYIPDWASDPPAGHSDFVLEQVDATGSVCERRTFGKKAILFGRVDKVCDVLVIHVSASRVHACVGFDAIGKLQVGDLGSTHGTSSLDLLK